MTTPIKSLNDLFIDQARELYDAAKLEKKELPKIQKQVHNQKLRQVIDRQLSLNHQEIQRLEEAFKQMGQKPTGGKSECCEAIIKHTHQIIKRSPEAVVRDAGIVGSLQRLNHNKITSLGTLSAYAGDIHHKKLATALHQAVDDEKAIDSELSEIAQKEINRNAMTAVAL